MSGYGVTDIWTYLIGAIGIILLPGPNSVFVLSVATARGVKAGIQGACGVFVGDTVLLGLTALGAAGLLHTYPALFLVVKYVGAAYLCWIGLNLLWTAIHNWRKPPAVLPQAPETPANLAHPFRRAFVISLLNPKAILFLLSFFVQFIDPGYHTPAVPFLILSSILMVLSALYLFSLIYAGAALAQGFRQRKRLTSGLSGAVGGLFVWFGAKLATASLN
ncbi:MAG TPA: leucine efflux protein LeuE [Burkholderiaceae bacterium]|nr:leucine efflux protein LeuE [Burkholderiaceae bacterium]